jgi:pimeloyl-ACP methyl ester carboxylesterase
MPTIRANGIEIAYLDHGAGPLVVMLHGYPDVPATWSHQIDALVAAGYRVVAPWLRGYPPTEIPRDGYYDKATLATDVARFIRAVGDDRPVHLVGQDWGAIITYAVLAAFPEYVRKAVVMAIPHPAETARSMLEAKHVQRSFHWWFFQLPELPERAIAANDFAFIDHLWAIWSAPGYSDPAHLAEVKALLRRPGAVTSTLAYYRAMLDPAQGDPGLDEVRRRLDRIIHVPTLALCGGEDLRRELMRDQGRYFSGEYRYEEIPGAGHFLHRETPRDVNRLLLGFLGSP